MLDFDRLAHLKVFIRPSVDMILSYRRGVKYHSPKLRGETPLPSNWMLNLEERKRQ